MILAAFDFETTSLDTDQAKVVEYGVLLYTTTYKRVVMAESYVVDNEEKVPSETTRITKLNTPIAQHFGLTSKDALSRIQNFFDMAEAVVGKNITDYDLPVYKNWCLREHEEPIEKLTIDIDTDLPGVENNKLAYMCAEAGFLNPFPHAALADAWSSLRLVEIQPDFEKVLERAKSPRTYIQAFVDFDNNHLAKERKFRWYPQGKVWYKIIKEIDIEDVAKEAPFDIKRIPPVPRH
jgi:DNA polymerase III alpha subunit (gram-positive type)